MPGIPIVSRKGAIVRRQKSIAPPGSLPQAGNFYACSAGIVSSWAN